MEDIVRRKKIFMHHSFNIFVIHSFIFSSPHFCFVLFQTKLEIQKALSEDATVYEYDSIYDEMQQKKKENNARMLSGNDDKKVDT